LTRGARLAFVVGLFGDLSLQFVHHVRVPQRRHVAERPALGDIPRQTAHDLA